MPALQITITDAGRAEIINAANTGTAPVTITEVGLGTGQYVPTANQVALQAETKRLATIAGVVVADDTIHVTIKDESNDAYNVSEFGLYTASGTLFAVYSQAIGPFMQKAGPSSLLLSVDVILGTLDANNLTFGDTGFANPPASESTPGVVELATAAEVIALADALRAITPAGLAAFLAAYQTPAQFDNSNDLATAAFVQRALGSYQNAVVVGANTELTAADAGKQIICIATTPITITLPSIPGMPPGAAFHIVNYGSQPVSVVPAAGNSINNNNGYSSLSLGINDTLELAVQSDVSTIWRILKGSLALAYSSLFGSSIAASGYQKLPSGLIVQWGDLSDGSWVATTFRTVNFPITFPTAVYQCFATLSDSFNNNAIVNSNVLSTSQVQLSVSSSGGHAVRYFAIGR